MWSFYLDEGALAWAGSGTALDKKGVALGGWRLQLLSVFGDATDAMDALGAAWFQHQYHHT